MLRFAVFGVAALGVLAVAVAIGVAVRRAPFRVQAPVLAVLLLALPFTVPWTGILALDHVERGWRQCDLCGRIERVVAILGVPVRVRAPEETPPELAHYAEWMAPLAAPHDLHAWAPIACWHRGRSVSCTMRQPTEAWHVCLPRVADHGLAERAARAFVAAEPDQRRRWLGSAAMEAGRPSHGDAPEIVAERQAGFERWLRATF